MSGALGFVASGLRSVGEYGVGRALKLAAFELYYELKLRSGTGRLVRGEELGVDARVLAHGAPHLPSPYYFAHRAFRHLGGRLEGGVFVDFGCGLGRALIFASQFPLRRVVGVEASPRLAEAARRNLVRLHGRRRTPAPAWSVVCCDAADFEVPADANLFYFGDPFDETVLEPVVRNILGSRERDPRPLAVVYVHPVHGHVFAKRGFRVLASEVNPRGRGFMVLVR
jgi:SAM-dependent methyltransferase